MYSSEKLIYVGRYAKRNKNWAKFEYLLPELEKSLEIIVAASLIYV